MGKHLVQLYGGCSSGQKPGPTWDDHGLEDWKKPHIAPDHHPESALVNNANGNDVDTVMVNGEIVVRNKKSTKIDEIATH